MNEDKYKDFNPKDLRNAKCPECGGDMDCDYAELWHREFRCNDCGLSLKRVKINGELCWKAIRIDKIKKCKIVPQDFEMIDVDGFLEELEGDGDEM